MTQRTLNQLWYDWRDVVGRFVGGMWENNLKLNDSETQFMVLASKHQLPQVNRVITQVGVETRSAAESTK